MRAATSSCMWSLICWLTWLVQSTVDAAAASAPARSPLSPSLSAGTRAGVTLGCSLSFRPTASLRLKKQHILFQLILADSSLSSIFLLDVYLFFHVSSPADIRASTKSRNCPRSSNIMSSHNYVWSKPCNISDTLHYSKWFCFSD